MPKAALPSSSGLEPTARRLRGVAESFAAAEDACGGSSSDFYEIAGGLVRLRFASPALRERLTPAFAHLAVHPGTVPGEQALTVNLWDSASTGVVAPPRPPVPEGHAAGALFHFSEPPLRAAYQPGLESLSIFDSEAGMAWHWVADAFDQSYWEAASPIRQILSWWLDVRGYLQVHGGAVGTPDGGVLLVGKGGSGKSTVALSSLGSMLLYAGDDYVAVRVEPSPQIESLYNSGKLEPAHVHGRLPHLLPLLTNGDRLETEKAVLYAQDHFPSQTTRGFPLLAVLVPRVRPNQKESRIVDVSRAAAFAALGPSTIIQLHTAGATAFSTMSSLVQRVSCYGLEVGTDVGAIPGTIAEFLSRPQPSK